MTGRRPFRFLSEEEIELWRAVAGSVQPRAGSSLPVVPKAEVVLPAPPPAEPPRKPAVRIGVVASYTPPRSQPKAVLPPLSPIERRTKRRITQGQIPIGAVLDLHGLNQAEAHHALRGFLRRAQSDDLRLVLVVTGKGRSARVAAAQTDEIGILKRAVPHWLREPDLRTIVLSVEEASQPHGGSGALYIRLRRRGD